MVRPGYTLLSRLPFFLIGFLPAVFLPLLPPGEHPAMSKPRPRARGGAFAHVTRRSVGSLVVLLGKLGEESHSRVRKKCRYSLDQRVSHYSKTIERKTKESMLIVRFHV